MAIFHVNWNFHVDLLSVGYTGNLGASEDEQEW